MAKWFFTAGDNGGKVQRFTVSAASKPAAIKKGMDRAKKHADGTITGWTCNLKSAD